MTSSRRFKNHITKIKRRNGEIVPFSKSKIEEAIYKALTATDEGGRKLAKELAGKVTKLLNRRFKKGEVPTVEHIQDIVEEVLILENLVETAKAYILYREQRRRIREARISSEEAVSLVDDYLNERDWEVKENSNMAFSLQGLNHYVSAHIAKRYWLNRIYPPEIRKAAESGDFHIHNLDIIGAYCMGWDLEDLLLKGFGGVPGKIQSKPPKHFRSALGQIVNYLYTLQGESAGAQAFSNFDTLLAPFIRYDNLSYTEVKQSLQEFLFNCNVPTRVGFQCVSEDTEILTPNGWKNYQEVKKGDVITTFNLKTKALENKRVSYVFKKYYNGIMYRLRNRIQDQLISPRHRVVRRRFYSDKYCLEPIEEVIKLKSPFIIPIAGENMRPDAKISDEQIKLMAWIISEGSIEHKGKHRSSFRVSIYQSPLKNRKNYKEIIKLLKHFKLKYSEYKLAALGDEVARIRLDAKSSRVIHQWFNSKENVHFIPEILTKLSKRQSRLFLETYLKGDGFEGCKISTTNLDILDGLETICVNAGYGFTILKRKPTIGKKDIYVLRIIKHPETYIRRIEKVNYRGIIWSVHTENETVIARRNGKVFITGNTPFTNITLDLKVPEYLKDTPVIIGGQPQRETYKDFQKEMDLFNQVLTEVYTEGDAVGRVFTFPIPTYNITKDFDWNNPAYDKIWGMTAKYGIPYFSNFINSDMKPEDARSMCLDPEEEILIRDKGNIKRETIGEVVENYRQSEFDREGWAECNQEKNLEALSLNYQTGKIEWARVLRFLRIKDNKLVTITTEEGKQIKCSSNHLVPVLTEGGLVNKFAREVEVGDYLLNLKKCSGLSNQYQKLGENLILDEDLAKILGFFTADGNYLLENRKNLKTFNRPKGLQFTFNAQTKANLKEIKGLIKKVFGITTKEKKDPRYNSYYLYVYNSKIARILFDAGFRKYGRLPNILFNSPVSVIENFLLYHFKGDGYERRKEIHINDKNLARDLVILYSLIGKPVTYRERENSQVIYIQHNKSKIRKDGILATPLLFQRVPGFVAKSTFLVPGLVKSRMVGLDTLEKYNASTTLSFEIKYSDYYITRVKKVEKKILSEPQVFLDIELEKNHLFIHSLGAITHNCCRLRLDNRELYKRGGGLFGANPLTGSIGVVTINLPRIAYLSKTKREFFRRLTELMELAKNSLEIKRKVLEYWTEKGLYPYSKYYLAGVKKMRGSYWGNHFSTIGIVGMNEALLNFLGVDIGTKTGIKFASEILDFMRERLVKYQQETGNLFNLEATPAEGTSYRLALKDKKKYPDIITAGEKEPYYTNSSQLPVNYTDDLFKALELQDELQCKYTGGTVFHAFLGEAVSDPSTVKSLIKTIFERFKLPYFTFTPTFSICPVHGYIPGEHFTCPYCAVEQPCEVYSRVVGYLRPVQQWHKGKQEEFRQRKTFRV